MTAPLCVHCQMPLVYVQDDPHAAWHDGLFCTVCGYVNRFWDLVRSIAK